MHSTKTPVTAPLPVAKLELHRTYLQVVCPAAATRLDIDAKKAWRDQISSVAFAHERQHGRGQCDLTTVYHRGSPGFLASLAAAHDVADRVERLKRRKARAS